MKFSSSFSKNTIKSLKCQKADNMTWAQKKCISNFLQYVFIYLYSFKTYDTNALRKKIITQDHVAKFANLTAIDRTFILRNINQTMLLEIIDFGT